MREREEDQEKDKMDQTTRPSTAGKLKVCLNAELPLARGIQLLYSGVTVIECVKRRTFELDGLNHGSRFTFGCY
jgi:hypothetical protein